MTREEEKELSKIVKQLSKQLLKCEENLKNLPKGSIFIRKINNQKYVYRNRKENNKVLQEYLGKYEDSATIEEIKKSKLYKNNKINEKRLIKQIEDICKKANKEAAKKESEALKFAMSINSTDGIKPSYRALALLRMLEKNIIDLATYEFALDRIYEDEK